MSFIIPVSSWCVQLTKDMLQIESFIFPKQKKQRVSKPKPPPPRWVDFCMVFETPLGLKPSKWTKKILALEPSTIFCFGWISLQINQEKIAVSPFPSIFYSKMIGFREFEVISAWKLFSESLHYMCGVFPCPTELNVDKTPNVLSLDPGFLQMMILFYLTDGSSWNPHWFVSCLLGCPWKLLTGWFHPYISRL